MAHSEIITDDADIAKAVDHINLYGSAACVAAGLRESRQLLGELVETLHQREIDADTDCQPFHDARAAVDDAIRAADKLAAYGLYHVIINHRPDADVTVLLHTDVEPLDKPDLETLLRTLLT